MIGATPFNGGTKYIAPLYRKYGFITKPDFIDHIGKWYTWKWLLRESKRRAEIHNRRIRFALAYDDAPLKDLEYLKQYVDDIILPLRHTSYIQYYPHFEWIGMPNRKDRRNYDTIEFLALTEGKKRWYLGLPHDKELEILRCFDGFDCSFPHFLAKRGLIWYTWGDTELATEYSYLERLEWNLFYLRKAVDELL